MYSQQLLRINHDERLRQAETRRLINQTRAVSRRSLSPRHGRSLGLVRGLGLRHA